MALFQDAISTACLVWYAAVVLVCSVGIYQIRRHTLKRLAPSVSGSLPIEQVPHVTIIRPVKGLEPHLYECLAATFQQQYPRERMTVYFCISTRNDPACSVLEDVISDYTSFDAKILVEEEDPKLSGRDGKANNLGPNPKIRNMSRAYREAKGDVIWIIDCNVWISSSAAARMVDLLCGFTPGSQSKNIHTPYKYKFVHQLPLAVDVSTVADAQHVNSLSSGPRADPFTILFGELPISKSGGLLDELFLSTSHAKFYTAISTVAIAPCIVGKSNMFRRSHLNVLTTTSDASPSADSDAELRDPGIDFFSDNICEDHLIGDLLWRSPIPDSVQQSAANEGLPIPIKNSSNTPVRPSKMTWGNHGLLAPHPSNLATQPTSRMPLSSYMDRRTRWLRVRKFTVTAATLVEPGTESLLCSAYGAWGLTTLPRCHTTLNIPQSWTAFWLLYFLSVSLWATADRYTWTLLQHHNTGDVDDRPRFGRTRGEKRGLGQWLLAWLGREILAFPIWIWAVVGGVTVVWRGRRFWVGTDMQVHEMDGDGGAVNREERGMNRDVKGRVD